jgi:hypothetical protein
MPKVVKLYKGSRSGLEHNMGGWFEKKKKSPPEPKPKKQRLEMKQEKKKKDEWTENTKRGLAARRKALKEAMGD